jgi:DNA-binding HxlR family transcriptional regulator
LWTGEISMISNEERILLYLKALGGEADATALLESLGSERPISQQRLGLLISGLVRRGVIERRKVKTTKCRTIYKLKMELCDPPLK